MLENVKLYMSVLGMHMFMLCGSALDPSFMRENTACDTHQLFQYCSGANDPPKFQLKCRWGVVVAMVT